MKNSVQNLAIWMAIVALALPALAQQTDSEACPLAKQLSTTCPACKAAQSEASATCPASCEDCLEGDQACDNCAAARQGFNVAACKKCQVATTVSTDVPVQQAAATCSSSCPFCTSTTASDAECAASIQCKSGNCYAQNCNGQPCQSCPTGQSTCTLEVTGPLPGSVSFVNENAGELTQQRLQLADDLVVYLTSQGHNPEHIRQVLRMALESTADDAHRAAMNMKHSETFRVGLPMSNAPCCPDQEMTEMRQLVMEMRNEMDVMGESMRFLARHLREQSGQSQQNASMQNPNSRWVSQPNPMPPYAHQNEPLSDTQLYQRNQREMEQRRLPVQTSPMNNMPYADQHLSASWNPQGQLQPASWQTEPLRPKVSLEMQLNPAPVRVSTMMARQYYVGDLISPPFASATLRLMQHIKSSVAPDSWEQASIEIVSPSVSLLVTQTPENHEKIAQMLNAMRGGDSFR